MVFFKIQSIVFLIVISVSANNHRSVSGIGNGGRINLEKLLEERDRSERLKQRIKEEVVPYGFALTSFPADPDRLVGCLL